MIKLTSICKEVWPSKITSHFDIAFFEGKGKHLSTDDTQRAFGEGNNACLSSIESLGVDVDGEEFLKEYKNWLFKQNYKSELEQASIIILRDYLKQFNSANLGRILKVRRIDERD